MKNNKSFAKWLKTRPNGLAFLISSRSEYTYEDYMEWCEDMEETPAEEGSHEFYDWVAEMQMDEFECDKMNIKTSSTLKPYKVLITGRLGLWWGHPTIYPEIHDNLLDAIMRCAEDDLEAEYDEKCVYVNSYHHDGTNCFRLWLIKPTADIRELEERIEKAKKDDPENGFDPENSYNRRYFAKITDWLF